MAIEDQEVVGAPSAEEEPARIALPPVVSVSIVGTFLILLLAALYYARSFVLPIVLAILFALTFGPVVRELSRRGVPDAISAALIVVGLGTAAIGMSAVVSPPVANMVAEAPAFARELRERFAFLNRPLAMLNQAGREFDSLADGTDGEQEQEVVLARPGMIAWAAGTVADIGTTLIATLLLTPFLLAARESMRLKLVRIVPKLSGRKRSLHVLGDIESDISRYLLTVTTINAGLGVVVGLTMAVLGMPNPVLWGVGAALLNFIPYAGATIGIIGATAVAAVTFESLAVAALPPLTYLAFQIVESTLITPLALGRRLELSVVTILIALAFTTWMWGIVGAIIGVPLLVVFKAVCDRFPSLAPVSVLLSGANHLHNGAAEHAGREPLTSVQAHGTPPEPSR